MDTFKRSGKLERKKAELKKTIGRIVADTSKEMGCEATLTSNTTTPSIIDVLLVRDNHGESLDFVNRFEKTLKATVNCINMSRRTLIKVISQEVPDDERYSSLKNKAHKIQITLLD